MSKPLTKKQHYVPQCLLKHFCYDEKNSKRINIFDTDKCDFRYNQLIKGVFAQNYFYDKDNRVENFIANKIEGPTAQIIDELVKENFKAIHEKQLILSQFILSLLVVRWN
jgi:hypothetical protein